jgi:23S rRNA pseudouridine2605 synthase
MNNRYGRDDRKPNRREATDRKNEGSGYRRDDNAGSSSNYRNQERTYTSKSGRNMKRLGDDPANEPRQFKRSDQSDFNRSGDDKFSRFSGNRDDSNNKSFGYERKDRGDFQKRDFNSSRSDSDRNRSFSHRNEGEFKRNSSSSDRQSFGERNERSGFSKPWSDRKDNDFKPRDNRRFEGRDENRRDGFRDRNSNSGSFNRGSDNSESWSDRNKNYRRTDGFKPRFDSKTPWSKNDDSFRSEFRKSDQDSRSFGDKPYKKNFGSDDNRERRSYGDRSNGERSYGNKFGDRSNGERSYGNKFGDRSNGDRSYGNKFGERSNGERSYSNKFGDRSDKRSFGDKSFEPRERRSFNNDRDDSRSFGDDRFQNRNFSSDDRGRKPYKSDRDFTKNDRFNSSRFENESYGERKKEVKHEPSDEWPIRLNRFIANSGVCSRRAADELISNGHISVNDTVVKEMGHKVNKDDVVTYDGKVLSREKLVYLLLNKPKDFITTTDDPNERKTVMQLVSNATEERIVPVGRLDRNTTGLLLFTNDGDLAMKLSHPSNEISKVYHVMLDKALRPEDMTKIAEGVELEDGQAFADEIAFPVPEDHSQVGLEIHSGKNRIVRRIFAHLGYDVVKLDRVCYAGLTKKDLPRGHWRHLSNVEVSRLKNAKRL